MNMRTYKIVHIKKEYQSFVLGREKLLHDLLFRESHLNETEPDELKYVCEGMNTLTIQQGIQGRLKRVFTNMKYDQNHIYFEHPLKGSIEMEVQPFCINVCCEGSQMLDLDLFAGLSDTSDCYMAFQKEQSSFGWLKPIKIGSIHSFSEIHDFV
jgi:Sporulation inhibitor of replication protein SirA